MRQLLVWPYIESFTARLLHIDTNTDTPVLNI